jgi:hypothetical protein
MINFCVLLIQKNKRKFCDFCKGFSTLTLCLCFLELCISLFSQRATAYIDCSYYNLFFLDSLLFNVNVAKNKTHLLNSFVKFIFFKKINAQVLLCLIHRKWIFIVISQKMLICTMYQDINIFSYNVFKEFKINFTLSLFLFFFSYRKNRLSFTFLWFSLFFTIFLINFFINWLSKFHQKIYVYFLWVAFSHFALILWCFCPSSIFNLFKYVT